MEASKEVYITNIMFEKKVKMKSDGVDFENGDMLNILVLLAGLYGPRRPGKYPSLSLYCEWS